MCTGLFCLVLSYSMSSGWISVISLIVYLYFRIASLGQSQLYESQVASEATLRDTDEIYLYQTATNHSKARTVCHIFPLQWRHNGLDGVSNHQPQLCLLNRLFWRRPKKTSKLRVTGLWREFPAQMASNAENVSIWWRHHVRMYSAKWMRFENYNIIHELLLHISIKVSSDLIRSYRWHARLMPIAQNPASYKFHGKLGNLWKPHCSSWWISP